MLPNFITFTGVDARTDLRRLADLSRAFHVEWGILFSRNRQGLDNRYPEMAVVEAALALPEINFAAHLCGKHAHEIMEGGFDRGSLPLERFRRIQVNHTAPATEKLRAFAAPDQVVIAQWRDEQSFPTTDEGISWLYDPSGGRGTRPTAWPINQSARIVGYAGGINAENCRTIVGEVMDRSQQGYWIDMETGIRTDDWLDLDRCEAVLGQVGRKR